MKYCLSVSLHNLFYDIAIVNDKHQIVKKMKCKYDLNKDISNNIYLTYKKSFFNYPIEFVGVAISNNISFKDNIIYRIKLFNFNHYDLKLSLNKLFKKEVYINEETQLASLTSAYNLNSDALLYVLLDNRISNSFVICKQIIELDDDINLNKDVILDKVCSKTFLKRALLSAGYDDDFVNGCFYSKNEKCLEIVKKWSEKLDDRISKLVEEINVNEIVFGGYLGQYFDEYKDYLSVSSRFKCYSSINHREETLIGVSNLIFKDN